jgi:hypothetical protein
LTNFGHTTLKEQQKSCIRKLVVDSQGPWCLCHSTNWLQRKSYLSGPTGVVFWAISPSSWYTIKNFVIAVVIPLEIVYPRPESWDLEKAWQSSRLFRSLV